MFNFIKTIYFQLERFCVPNFSFNNVSFCHIVFNYIQQLYFHFYKEFIFLIFTKIISPFAAMISTIFNNHTFILFSLFLCLNNVTILSQQYFQLYSIFIVSFIEIVSLLFLTRRFQRCVLPIRCICGKGLYLSRVWSKLYHIRQMNMSE